MNSRVLYVKEYDEALSRLNATERTPLPFIPRPIGPVPQYKTTSNWNRIMRETRHGALPKYTISQRCRCSWDDKVAKGERDMIYYNFKLDPGFLFCNGARKSIAVRLISGVDTLSTSSAYGQQINLIMDVDLVFNVWDANINPNGEQTFTVNGEHYEQEPDPAFDPDNDPPENEFMWVLKPNTNELTSKVLSIKWSDNNDVNLASICKLIQAYLDQQLFDENDLVTVLADLSTVEKEANDFFTTEVTCEDRNIHIRFNVKEGVNLTIEGSITLRAYGSYSKWMLNLTEEIIGESKVVQKDFKWGANDYKSDDVHEFIFRMNYIDMKRPLIGSSINPWSTGNVIGYCGFSSDTLNKVFPWNGSDEISFHAVGCKNTPCLYYGCDFTVELELIVDNEDSYAINE